jgi:E3 ubiquitin-protein ligase TRIP12
LQALTSNNLSVFEMISSSAVNRLTAYLQGADLPAAEQNDEQLLRRLRNFTVAALASHADAPAGDAAAANGTGAAAVASAAASSTPLAALVRKLQAALASAEAFPVLCSRLVPSGGVAGGSGARSLSRSGGMSGSFNSSSLTSGLAALTQPFKLRLVRHTQVSWRLQRAVWVKIICFHLSGCWGVVCLVCRGCLSCVGVVCWLHTQQARPSLSLACIAADDDDGVNDAQVLLCRVCLDVILQEHTLKEYPANIVLIEPLANMTAIEDFLWQRVNRGSTFEALRVRAAAEPAAGGSRAAEPAAAANTPAAAAAPSGAAAAAPGAAAAPAAAGTTTRRRSSSGGGSSKDGSAAARSKAQPIPEADGSGRMTRAQAARARAEAQARAEEAVNQRRAQRAGGRSAGGTAAAAGSSDGMSDEHEGPSEEDLLMPSDHDDEHMHDDGMDEDHDMDDGIFDHEDDDEDEDEEMDDADIGSMPVHDLHLAEGMAAAAAAAAAAASQAAAAASQAAAAASGSRAAAEGAAAASRAAEAAAPAAAAAGGAGGSDARAPWARSSAAPPTPPAANGAARTAAVVAGAGAGPKLVFIMNEQPLAAACTVFQAIQQSTLAANGGDDDDNGDEAGLGGNGRRGRQLWEQVYTLHYRLAGTEPQEPAAAAGPSSRAASGALAGPSRQSSMGRQGSEPPAAAAAAGETEAAAAGSDAVSQWRQSPLGELLAVQLPNNLAAPESCLDILRLVQLLEVINRLAPRMLASHELQLLPGAAAADGKAGSAAAAVSGQPSTAEEEAVGIAAVQAAAGQMALAHVPRDEFISSKLGNKLAQQLKDVLSICGGGIPAWCHQLVVSCRFLFPFEVRRRYFYSTAFGLGRALHHMHQQQAAEGLGGALERDGRELRIGRLQRQKVRVSRRRILDSAVKVSMRSGSC